MYTLHVKIILSIYTVMCNVSQVYICEIVLKHCKFLLDLVNSLPSRVQLCWLAIHLVCSRKQKHLGFLYAFELWMILVRRITEVLNFSHCKLSANKNKKLKLNILKSDIHYLDEICNHSIVHYRTAEL